jgi:hypothetical protein
MLGWRTIAQKLENEFQNIPCFMAGIVWNKSAYILFAKFGSPKRLRSHVWDRLGSGSFFKN